jgi:Tol biopolymer transport system component
VREVLVNAPPQQRRTRFGRLRLVVPVALAAAAVLVALPGPAQSAFPGQNGKIAFRAADHGIWVMDADGSNMTKINDAGDSPDWSADGKKIAFSRDRDVYMMNADGSNVTQLTHTADTYAPAWSPSGEKIAFDSNRAGLFEIYVMHADGSNVTQLTTDVPRAARFPAWSPDGQRIAFSDGFDLYVMNADGTNVTQLTHGSVEGYEDLHPDWSPDGQHIVFASIPNISGVVEPLQLYVIDANGSNRTRLTNSGTHDGSPAWSPAGDKIAFTCGTETCVVDADGSNRTQVTTTGGLEPNWQPLALPTRTATVEQPINADGSSVFKAGKGVLPVKFGLAVDGVPTCTLPPATIALAKLSGAASGAVNESEYTMPADTGSDFRIDSCDYVYNLNLKSLTAGTYRAKILIEGQTVGSAAFELR